MAAGLPSRTVAAFDLDGTLTRRDTLLPFLVLVAGRRRVAAVFARYGLPLIGSFAGIGDRDAVKEAVVGAILAGRSADAVSALGEVFAVRVLANLRSDAQRRVVQHRQQGHELVIVSASPAIYVAPIGRLLGAAAVLATELEVVDGRLTGRLLGRNCRGPEKVERLRSHLGDETCELWAYGDSSGDTELLAFAGERGCRVGHTRLTRRPIGFER